MAFVPDASVSACWAFADEDHPIADAAFSSLQTDEAVVPALWWFEVRNILVVNERRGEFMSKRPTSFFARGLCFGSVIDREPEYAGVLRIARARGLSVYDAA